MIEACVAKALRLPAELIHCLKNTCASCSNQLKQTRSLANQSEAKPKPFARFPGHGTSCAFSRACYPLPIFERAWHQLRVFARLAPAISLVSSSDWQVVLFALVVNGQICLIKVLVRLF